MNRNIFRLFAIIAIAGLAFTGCQKEEPELVPQESQTEFLTADKVETIKMNETAFSSKKSSFSEKQVFLDGGYVTINGSMFPTKIVGDQRWITMDYLSFISGTAFNNGNTTHHNYDAAMSLNGSISEAPRFMEPANLVENSTWRIPSWEDMNHLHHMVYGDEASIVTGLNMQATGMVQWDGSGIAQDEGVHQNPTYGIFWNSDLTTGSQGQTTWHLFATDTPTHVFGFEYQLQYPYAPIRLVQDVTPIQ